VKSLGQAQSSGCFRMMNATVLHLASIAEIGTTVTVVASLPKPVEVSKAESPAAATPKMLPEDRPSLRDYRDLRDYTLGRQP